MSVNEGNPERLPRGQDFRWAGNRHKYLSSRGNPRTWPRGQIRLRLGQLSLLVVPRLAGNNVRSAWSGILAHSGAILDVLYDIALFYAAVG